MGNRTSKKADITAPPPKEKKLKRKKSKKDSATANGIEDVSVQEKKEETTQEKVENEVKSEENGEAKKDTESAGSGDAPTDIVQDSPGKESSNVAVMSDVQSPTQTSPVNEEATESTQSPTAVVEAKIETPCTETPITPVNAASNSATEETKATGTPVVEESKPAPGAVAEESKPVESPKVEESKPVESPKVEETKPVESPKVEESKPVESPKVEESKPVESPKIEESKPVESPKVEESKLVESPKVEESNPVESPKAEDPQPAESPLSEESKPAESLAVEEPKQSNDVDETQALTNQEAAVVESPVQEQSQPPAENQDKLPLEEKVESPKEEIKEAPAVEIPSDQNIENHSDATNGITENGSHKEVNEVEVNGQENGPSEIPTLISWKNGGSQVAISGDFNKWEDNCILNEQDGVFSTKLKLPKGTHHLKYLVDGNWTVDESQPIIELDGHGQVNVLTVQAE